MKLRRTLAAAIAACTISTAVAAPATANPLAALSSQISAPSSHAPAPGSPEAQIQAVLGTIFFLLTGGIFGSSGVVLR